MKAKDMFCVYTEFMICSIFQIEYDSTTMTTFEGEDMTFKDKRKFFEQEIEDQNAIKPAQGMQHLSVYMDFW